MAPNSQVSSPGGSGLSPHWVRQTPPRGQLGSRKLLKCRCFARPESESLES